MLLGVGYAVLSSFDSWERATSHLEARRRLFRLKTRASIGLEARGARHCHGGLGLPSINRIVDLPRYRERLGSLRIYDLVIGDVRWQDGLRRDQAVPTVVRPGILSDKLRINVLTDVFSHAVDERRFLSPLQRPMLLHLHLLCLLLHLNLLRSVPLATRLIFLLLAIVAP